MPGFDGTGPGGMGPMTGWGRGYCNTPRPAYAPPQTFDTPYPGTAYGRGPGFGGGRGFRRGFGPGRGRGYGYGRGQGWR